MILLDGAQGLIIIPFLLVLHIVSTMLIEGGVLYAFKYNSWRRCTRDAFIVNLVSLVIGLLLMSTFAGLARFITSDGDVGQRRWCILVLFYVQTVLIEGAVLKLLHNNWPFKRLLPATLLMNLITYTTLFFILEYGSF